MHSLHFASTWSAKDELRGLLRIKVVNCVHIADLSVSMKVKLVALRSFEAPARRHTHQARC